MPATLRGRLLLSYVAVIAAALSIVLLALLALSFSQRARVLPSLRQLAAVSLGARRELNRLAAQGQTGPELAALLDETAAAHNVRILGVDRQSEQVVYDSRPGSGWTSVDLEAVRRPRAGFSAAAAGSPLGYYTAPDGSRWLFYPQLLPGELVILFARPEQSAWQLFRQVFLEPVCQAGLVALLLSALLAAAISRWVARPLQRMAAASAAIAQGDYKGRLPLEGPEETRRLAAAFNAMVS
ncbi:MAG: HAMP domain-containing protein, partial [Candidatus Promineifilaceae bacterium]